MEDDNIDYEIDKNLKFSKKYKDLTKSIRNLVILFYIQNICIY